MGIFVSYRRTDSQEVVGRMYDRLIVHFSVERVFRDLDSLPIGRPFESAIENAVAKSKVALIVIGPSWVSVTDDTGKRRLDNPRDYVRKEVEMSLNAGFPVVPVLVSNASLPDELALPESIRALCGHQSISIKPDPDFNHDMDRLIGKLSTIVGISDGSRSGSKIEQNKAFEVKDQKLRFPHLRNQVIQLLHGLYRKDPYAVFPADELPKLLELHPADLDDVLQDLRTSGHIVVMKHPSSSGALLRLTTEGIDLAAGSLAEQSDERELE